MHEKCDRLKLFGWKTLIVVSLAKKIIEDSRICFGNLSIITKYLKFTNIYIYIYIYMYVLCTFIYLSTNLAISLILIFLFETAPRFLMWLRFSNYDK